MSFERYSVNRALGVSAVRPKRSVVEPDREFFREPDWMSALRGWFGKSNRVIHAADSRTQRGFDHGVI
jgi:hypothetical protein